MATQTFIVTGTWTCPPGIFFVQVECWGAGGSGGHAAAAASASGGGGGAYSYKFASPVVPGTVYTVTVGAGGLAQLTAATDGNTGGDSWFNTSGTVSAAGGAGGHQGATPALGQGGQTLFSNGDVKQGGGSSGTGASTFGSGGGGAAGSGGGGGASTNVTTANTVGGAAGRTGGARADASGTGGAGSNGVSTGSSTAASSPGGGSGGASNGATGSGAGARGQVILTWYPVQDNNRQYVRVGDGMSTGERVR